MGEIGLDLEFEFDGKMNNTENSGKLKRIDQENEKKAMDTTWK